MIFYFILFGLFSFYLIYFINLEPYWIRKIDYYPSNFKEYIIGNTITNILTKKFSWLLNTNYRSSPGNILSKPLLYPIGKN